MTRAELIQESQSTRVLLLGVWRQLNSSRRIQLALLLVVMLVSGGAELVSLGAVLPFLAVLSDPDYLWQYSLIQAWAPRFGLTEPSHLLLPATLVFATAAVVAALIRLSNLWLNGRLAAAIGSDLSCEAFRRTLYQPYGVHVQRNSAELITKTTSQIQQTVVSLGALLQILTSAVVALGLLTGLLLIDAPVAMAAAALFAGAYAALALIVSRELYSNGYRIAEATTQQVKVLQEGLGAIRDLLLDGSQPTFVQIYREADRPQRQLQAKNAFLGAFPRYSLEALGMVAIALLGGVLVLQRGSGASVIPLLGALALGAQRLLPALQQIYNGWAVLNGNNASIQAVLAIISQPLPPTVIGIEPLPLRQGINLVGVNFRYCSDQPEILQGLDLEIRRGERIGLIGRTGSGKSTTVDILMGLLEPTSGQLLVDGENLHDPEHPERLVAWRASIAHVPQSIYLADNSIAENIAFGVPRHKIDMARVKQAAEQAQISGFIEDSTEGYNAFVGERGIRLSGGQRQRIGIARALYKKARLLVLDEATSALDHSTEVAVMEAVEDLSRSLTVVMIAHRLSTIARCDRVIELKNGCIARQTTGAVAAGLL
jgi:ATP-binding cassette subfamily B protein